MKTVLCTEETRPEIPVKISLYPLTNASVVDNARNEVVTNGQTDNDVETPSQPSTMKKHQNAMHTLLNRRGTNKIHRRKIIQALVYCYDKIVKMRHNETMRPVLSSCQIPADYQTSAP
jgi:hypothetical protein